MWLLTFLLCAVYLIGVFWFIKFVWSEKFAMDEALYKPFNVPTRIGVGDLLDVVLHKSSDPKWRANRLVQWRLFITFYILFISIMIGFGVFNFLYT